MSRRTDEELAKEYLLLYGIKPEVVDQHLWLILPFVQRAREDEPRINCVAHLVDWTMICDEDDDFDSFYGPDYFNEENDVRSQEE